MPENIGGEKVLPPSPRKKERAREEGNVARSQDLTSAVALASAMIALWFVAPLTFQHLLRVMRHYFEEPWMPIDDHLQLQSFMIEVGIYVAIGCLPYVLIMMLAGVSIACAQVGLLWTGKPLIPKLNRINPIAGFNRFFSVRALYELGKNIAKLAFLLVMVYYALRSRWIELIVLPDYSIEDMLYICGGLFIAVWWRIVLVMFILGIADYGFQWWQREQDLRMTIQEAREEMKEIEGDPAIKRRVRQMQRQLAYQRMLREVPKADVVITNPTEFAVALKYDVSTMPAPIVIAKGARIIASKIREIAAQHQVPIVQKPELARTLYKTVEVGQMVPENLFRAVAEVLAFIYHIDRREEKIRERQELLKENRKTA